ncbi:hypothetical protein [Roseateles chitosanitabidus]|uniref:hypothetical protein n=1 Tax=Roseateles chitosanitabidus TaxID=65048 RepID=UPI0011E03F93|nr:hypothetical protein [Roseateles chitosanitabidus]
MGASQATKKKILVTGDMKSIQDLRQEVSILRAQDKFQEAVHACDAFIRADDSCFAAYAERARLNYSLARYQEAFEDVKKQMELRPESPSPYYTRARWSLALGDEKLAAADAGFIIASGDEYFLSSAYFIRALANCYLGKKVEAMADCLRVPMGFDMGVETKSLGWRVMSREELLALIGR